MFSFPDLLFGSNLPKAKKQSKEVVDIVSSTKIAQTIEEIHHEFNTAGEKLLKKAQEIIQKSVINDANKISMLKQHGFYNVKQVKDASEIEAKKAEQVRIATAVEDYRVLYPNYKFITEEIALAICEKYNLVLGEVSRYKGFVPEKNLLEINKFYEQHPDAKYEYRYAYGINGSHWDVIRTKDDYENQNKKPAYTSLQDVTPQYLALQQAMSFAQAGISGTKSIGKVNTSLFICAPLKDMDMTGHELKGRQIVSKPISFPDPVVMKAELHKNGTRGFIIITAWGDEASDELIINQNNN